MNLENHCYQKRPRIRSFLPGQSKIKVFSEELRWRIMSPRLSHKGRIKTFFGLFFLLIVALVLDCQLRYPDKMIIYEGETLNTKNQSAFSLSIPAGTAGVLTETGELTEDSYNSTLHANQSGDFEMTLARRNSLPRFPWTILWKNRNTYITRKRHWKKWTKKLRCLRIKKACKRTQRARPSVLKSKRELIWADFFQINTRR